VTLISALYPLLKKQQYIKKNKIATREEVNHTRWSWTNLAIDMHVDYKDQCTRNKKIIGTYSSKRDKATLIKHKTC